MTEKEDSKEFWVIRTQLEGREKLELRPGTKLIAAAMEGRRAAWKGGDAIRSRGTHRDGSEDMFDTLEGVAEEQLW